MHHLFPIKKLFALTIVLFIIIFFASSFMKSASAQTVCTAPHGGKLTATYVTGPNGSGKGQATIYNNSSTCTYLVGLAAYSVYEPYDPDPNNLNWIYTQTYYAHIQQNLAPGRSITYQVNIPSCAWQIDAYQNDVLIDLLPGKLYQDNGTLIGGGWLQNDASYPLCPRYTVSGRVFEDLDPYNNSYDSGEPVFSNVKVEITRKLADGTFQPPCCYTNSRNTNSSGIYSWSNIVTPGTYRIFVPTIPDGYYSAASNPREKTVSSGNISANFPLRRTGYNWTGRVRIDPDNDCIFDTGETVYSAGAQLQLTGTSTLTGTTASNGEYTFSNLASGSTYTMTLVTIPSGYELSSCNDNTRGPYTITGDRANNFYIRLNSFTISGNVFVDANKNGKKVPDADPNYTATPITITLSPLPAGVTISYPAQGSYQISNVPAGNYRVTMTSPWPLPKGYTLTFPPGAGGSPYYDITAGSCSWNPQGGDTTCNIGNYSNLNFGLTNSNPWMQSFGLDMRFDRGFSNPIPQNPHASCKDSGITYAMRTSSASNTPGVLLIGDNSFDVGSGQLSQRPPWGWNVGGSSYPEIFRPTTSELKTSYTFMRNNAKEQGSTFIDIRTVSGCSDTSNCTIPSNLPSGVYVTELVDDGTYGNNPLTIVGNASFSGNNDYLFLVDGNLTLRNKTSVSTSTTATFSVAGDIIVDSSVGSPPTTCQATTRDLEGLFSADKSFILGSRANCSSGVSDLQMNISGSIVVNAKRQGGSFDNRRDLCGDNLSYPVLTISARPDFLIHAPLFLLRPNVIWQEVAP